MWSINGITQVLSNEQKAQVLIDTCTQLGFDIPRFCYHENLKIAGNCRMCLIEDSKAPKPVICCAGNPSLDLNIFTNTIQVKKSREAVMEFLLINHPLDCPICDQGGECDLQDLALVYGSDHGRFYDYKRNVEDKNCGPVVKTVMNRCILCTRCVRFATDIAGFGSLLGITGRGGKMEIGSYVEKVLDSDLSGNLIDICPVGALTSKPYAFVSRPWEIKKVNIFSLIDDQPQLVRADIKENEVVRFLPAKNAVGVNMWVTNRTRFSYEGLIRNRLVEPTIFGYEAGWSVLLNTLKNLIGGMLSTTNFKQNNILNVTFNDISNFDYFDLLAVRNILPLTGLSVGPKNLLSFTFLPRVTNFIDNTNMAILLNLNLNFELPITGLLLQQRLTANIEGLIPFLLTWRSTTTPLLKSFELSLSTAVINIFNFFQAKTWVNLLFGSFSTTNVLCIHTVEWNSILTNLKISFFKALNLFLFTLTAADRILFDINLFDRGLALQNTNYNNFSLLGWKFGNLKEFINNCSSSSAATLSHATHKENILGDVAFAVPTKSYLESNTVFYNLDYTYFKSYQAISSPVNCKSINTFIKVLYTILNLNHPSPVMQPLSAFSSTSWSIRYLSMATFKASFFSINCLLRKRLLSKINFYQMFSILTHSPTLSALQRSTYNLNIY